MINMEKHAIVVEVWQAIKKSGAVSSEKAYKDVFAAIKPLLKKYEV